MKSIYDISVEKKDSSMLSLEEYKGNTLLIVNTATGCGFTPQYDGLQDMYEKYQEKGFQILDFPCNQFANQAPDSDEEIGSFCTGNFGITFNQFKKIEVNGENESELFSYLKSQKKGLFGSKIKWNFTKFLVDKNGKVVKRYAPTVKPKAIEMDVEKIL
ncbi:MAG: glutathione peroxidase [Eubacteriaceae bacterium]